MKSRIKKRIALGVAMLIGTVASVYASIQLADWFTRMGWIAFLLCVSITTGCGGGGLSRKETIEAVKACTDAGMTPQVIQDDYNYNIISVNCLPKDDTK